MVPGAAHSGTAPGIDRLDNALNATFTDATPPTVALRLGTVARDRRGKATGLQAGHRIFANQLACNMPCEAGARPARVGRQSRRRAANVWRAVTDRLMHGRFPQP